MKPCKTATRKGSARKNAGCDGTSVTLEPWHSWGLTVRYVIIRLTQVMPTVLLLVWQAYLRH